MATDQYDNGYAAGARHAAKQEHDRYAEIDMRHTRTIARLKRENQALLKALGDKQDAASECYDECVLHATCKKHGKVCPGER